MSVGIYNDTSEFNGRVMHSYDLMETGRRLIVVITMHGTERLLGGFWFLKAMFYGSLLFYATRKIISQVWLGVIILLVLTFITSLFKLSVPYLKVGSLDLFAAFFIMVGHYMRSTRWREKPLIQSIITNWLVILLFAIVVGIGSVYWPTSMLQYKWYHVLPYAVTAILGTFVILAVGNRINKWTIEDNNLLSKSKSIVKNFLIYTGGYTLNVLTWHFLSFKIISLVIIFIYGLSWERLGDFPGISSYARSGFWVAYLFIGIGVPVAGTYIYHLVKERFLIRYHFFL